MRHRFKTSRICSSDNYELSRKLSKAQKIEASISYSVRKCYVKCFDKLVEISKEEAIRIHKSVEIVLK